FQAEDGIRDRTVTGVQTCALPISALCEPTAVVLKGLKRIQWALAAEKKPCCAVVGSGTIGHLCARVLASRGYAVTAFDRLPERRSEERRVGKEWRSRWGLGV